MSTENRLPEGGVDARRTVSRADSSTPPSPVEGVGDFGAQVIAQPKSSVLLAMTIGIVVFVLAVLGWQTYSDTAKARAEYEQTKQMKEQIVAELDEAHRDADHLLLLMNKYAPGTKAPEFRRALQAAERLEDVVGEIDGATAGRRELVAEIDELNTHMEAARPVLQQLRAANSFLLRDLGATVGADTGKACAGLQVALADAQNVDRAGMNEEAQAALDDAVEEAIALQDEPIMPINTVDDLEVGFELLHRVTINLGALRDATEGSSTGDGDSSAQSLDGQDLNGLVGGTPRDAGDLVLGGDAAPSGAVPDGTVPDGTSGTLEDSGNAEGFDVFDGSEGAVGSGAPAEPENADTPEDTDAAEDTDALEDADSLEERPGLGIAEEQDLD
ncbi:MAG: hypothetical protein Q4E01_05790 [Actinomycetaceae bacterium]|nr:hypothetical protein [Actinomycetaceae bacterium]